MEMEFKLNHMSRLIREARGLSLVATALFALTACGGSDGDGGGDLGITAPGDGSGTGGGDTGGGDTGGGDTGGGDTGGGDTGGGDTGGGEDPAPEPEEPKPTTYAFSNASAVVMVDGSMAAHGYRIGSATTFAQIVNEFDGTSPVTNVVYSSSMDAFAAQREDGVALVWGNRAREWESSPGNVEAIVDNGSLGENIFKLSNVKELDSGEGNLVVTHTDGTVSVFGRGNTIDKPAGVGLAGVDSVTSLCPDRGYVAGVQNGSRSFAAIKSDGSVIAWGTTAGHPDAGFPGGAIGAAAQYLDGTVPVTAIACLESSALGEGGWALREDGAVVTWGTNTQLIENAGVAKVIDLGINTVVVGADGSIGLARDVDGFSPLTGYTLIEASYEASKEGMYLFRVEKDGMQKIMFYSDTVNGEFDIDSADKIKSIEQYPFDGMVFVTESGAAAAFAAESVPAVAQMPVLTNADEVVMSAHGYSGVAKLKDGTVQAWGEAARGGDTSSVAAELAEAKITHIGGAQYSLYALNENGKVIGWGDLNGEENPIADNVTGVVALYQNTDRHNTVGLGSDGSVVAWGEGPTGGDLTNGVFGGAFGDSPVTKIVTSGFGYAAELESGKALYWGGLGCHVFGKTRQPVCDDFVNNNNYEGLMRVGHSVLAYRPDGTAISLHTDDTKLP